MEVAMAMDPTILLRALLIIGPLVPHLADSVMAMDIQQLQFMAADTATAMATPDMAMDTDTVRQ